MSLLESLARRDFTCNAMALDPATGVRSDPFGGVADIEAGVLRHTSPRFAEDPIRVLRGVQLVARFDWSVAPETLAVFRSLAPGDAPMERIGREWRKLLLDGVRISRGLAVLAEADWLRFFPELEALVGCPQDPVHHPEGDVWVHTGHCLDAFAELRLGDAIEDWIVGLAVLCHDLGKPSTTREREGRLTAWRHDAAGADITRSFLARLTDEVSVVDAVTGLVAAHLAPGQLHRDGAGDAAVRRLARAVGRIDRLVRVAHADHAGRPPRSDRESFAAGAWLLQRARALEVEDRAPVPLLRGRDLLALGLAPGPEIGRILDLCYEAQLDGEIASREEGLALVERTLGRRPN
jgi:tRNA nucleotidyltransferase (CCA-adding enzyme)